jgi:hypothetical protein
MNKVEKLETELKKEEEGIENELLSVQQKTNEEKDGELNNQLIKSQAKYMFLEVHAENTLAALDKHLINEWSTKNNVVILFAGSSNECFLA